ncbi:MAG: RNA polymerase sigma factor [Candidatus Buchananbacteria bacterium]|jgi:RNA polymerase sigma-70 factor (ECF subfamily)
MNNPIVTKILFLRVQNKDHEAYGQFYDLYVDKIYRFVFFKVNSTEDAKDLTSEVFLKTWQYIKNDKVIKNLNAFVYMVARNCIIDFYRERSRKDDNEEFINEAHLAIGGDSPLLKHIKQAEISEVLKAMSQLKDEYREAIILHYLNELSAKEMSQILEKSPGAVRVLLYRALNALKSTINKSK